MREFGWIEFVTAMCAYNEKKKKHFSLHHQLAVSLPACAFFYCVFFSVCDCKERDRLVHRRYNLYLTAENELLEGEMMHNSSFFFFSFVEMAHCGVCFSVCSSQAAPFN